MARDPETDAEWQEAADAAYFCLVLDSAVQYGLVEPLDKDPESDLTGIDAERCEWILEQAKKRGIVPKENFDL